MIIKEYNLKVSEIIEETHDTKTLRINFNKDGFSFEPGQFVNFSIDIIQNGEVKTLTRQYSISSSSTKKDYIDITIKKMVNGVMSNYVVDNIKIGTPAKIKGPYGVFTFKEDVKKAVFIAGGSGISSLMSMIRYIIDKNLDTDFTLLFSNKTPDDIIFRKELEDLSDKGFKIINTVTRYNNNDWNGEIGRIDSNMIKKYADLDSIFYICGLPEMVDDVRRELENLSIDKSKIKFEKY